MKFLLPFSASYMAGQTERQLNLQFKVRKVLLQAKNKVKSNLESQLLHDYFTCMEDNFFQKKKSA